MNHVPKKGKIPPDSEEYITQHQSAYSSRLSQVVPLATTIFNVIYIAKFINI